MSIHYSLMIEMIIQITQDLLSDINSCKELNVDLVYAPEVDITTEIDIEDRVDLPKFSGYLCGHKKESL